MKMVSLIMLVLFSFIHSIGQNITPIDVAQLVQITRTSDYVALVKLSKALDYAVLDSSKDKAGGISYITKEVKIFGNTLSCGTDSKLKIKQVFFTTYDKETYDFIKKKVPSFGLKSSGKSTGHFPEIVEAEDFEGKGIYVSSSEKKEDDGMLYYEFVFFKW